MSDFTRELIPILVMYGFVLLLGPFVGFAMWLAFDGDAKRAAAMEAAATAHDGLQPSADAAPVRAAGTAAQGAAPAISAA